MRGKSIKLNLELRDVSKISNKGVKTVTLTVTHILKKLEIRRI